MNKKLIVILVAVLLLGGGGAAAFFLLTGDAAEAEAATEETATPAGLVPLEPFLVNLAAPDDDRFVKVHLQLTVVPQEAAEAILADATVVARIRDRILTLLAAKSHEQLVSPIGKEGLRREIQARVAPLIEPDRSVEDVLFSEFVVQ